MSNHLENRYDFVFYFDVENGNPNGDPDAGNLPRTDPETGYGFTTDVSIKRKIRNYVQLKYPLKDRVDEGKDFRIYVKEKGVLNLFHEEAYLHANSVSVKAVDNSAEGEDKKKDAKGNKRIGSEDQVDKARAWMCEQFYDVRTFGAVMSTGVNAGQVRGPVQLTFARSQEPIFANEVSITRMAVATEKEAEQQKGDNRTIGKKAFIPYGLYRAEGFISANLANQTGFDSDDLELLWEAILNMYEHDRSASRGKVSVRKLVVFKHDNKMGKAPAQTLFDLVQTKRVTSSDAPARAFSDYQITIAKENVPAGVELIERL
ncbi:type I-C CRISPR-associated protein Cas7/Csd2 [Entomospira culicis]|uniref:Type I-C CRISPR-associated protein Cas7/Csd2 n=1 Tax=Entomospira culicis TaxID=2719989 RepID=A0A968GHL6_9SPIO|nr:type I-C CRISPR-associated protein Cas7/Csd2 [Entomospira culicis]NIZ18919.1 type I-C CRISPR-associated protein Cas7/Csd2 [Entomospira culicis]NIZ69134.1 type I-C CRISPR-associated protein Cas7/Csd2 [Entomospira culicis]WDI37720.1 type I-C CRISPR-associated protein Cas7/Csd2 [Entomospira culicis]WDI39348.1 type I-C CRISPR-associated protein Cas7/Csd2 [Entomospira culicis]